MSTSKRLLTRWLVCAALLSAWQFTANAQQVSAEICGSLQNAYGPLDYRTERGNSLQLVESAHFTARVESLLGGNTASGPGHDLDYTLRAYPNHHRALVSVMRWTERDKSLVVRGLPKPAECYFERAVRWRRDDLVVRMLYGQLLYKHGRPAEAQAQLEYAASQAGESALTLYNIGLVYLEAKDFPRALEMAHRAYALGMPRPELRERLVAAGEWKDAPAATSEAPVSSPVPATGPASASPPASSPAS